MKKMTLDFSRNETTDTWQSSLSKGFLTIGGCSSYCPLINHQTLWLCYKCYTNSRGKINSDFSGTRPRHSTTSDDAVATESTLPPRTMSMEKKSTLPPGTLSTQTVFTKAGSQRPELNSTEATQTRRKSSTPIQGMSIKCHQMVVEV